MRASGTLKKTNNPLLKRKRTLLYIPMATPSSFIVIYNAVSLQCEIITIILPRKCRTGKRADFDHSHRKSKVLDTV